MADEEGGDHYEEETCGEREDDEERRVQAYEGVGCEEGDGLRGLAPGEETDQSVLKDKGDADAGVEAAEVGRHGGDAEGGPVDVGARPTVLNGGRCCVIGVFLWGKDLLEKPGERKS